MGNEVLPDFARYIIIFYSNFIEFAKPFPLLMKEI